MRKACAALGLLIVSAGAFAAWALHAADGRLRELEREAARDVELYRESARNRPPILDEPQPGRADDAYLNALKAWEAFRGSRRRLPPRSEAFEDFARGPAEQVALALRRSRLDHGRDFSEGMARAHHSRFLELWEVLLAAEAGERRAGRAAEALRRSASLLGLWCDALRGVDAYGISSPPRLHGPFRAWQKALDLPGLGAEDLRRAEGWLERVERALPAAFDAFRVQHLLERTDIVLAWRGRQSNWASAAAPRWFHFGSRNLLYCSLLKGLERQHADVLELERLPARERLKAALKLAQEHPPLGEGRPWLGAAEALLVLDLSRLQVSLMKTAAALRAIEAETGRPAALSDLPAVPGCPFTGAPFRYEGGKLWAGGPDFDDDGGRPAAFEGDDESDGDVVLILKR